MRTRFDGKFVETFLGYKRGFFDYEKNNKVNIISIFDVSIVRDMLYSCLC